MPDFARTAPSDRAPGRVPRRWQDIAPADAVRLSLAVDLSVTAPCSGEGARCPWPWEPQQLVDMPIGQYHCPYCGAMCIAGVEHPDYGDGEP